MNSTTILQLNQRLAALRQHVEQIAEAAELGFITFTDTAGTIYECAECQSDTGRDPKALTHESDCVNGCYQRALTELEAIEQMVQIAMPDEQLLTMERHGIILKNPDAFEDQL